MREQKKSIVNNIRNVQEEGGGVFYSPIGGDGTAHRFVACMSIGDVFRNWLRLNYKRIKALLFVKEKKKKLINNIHPMSSRTTLFCVGLMPATLFMKNSETDAYMP